MYTGWSAHGNPTPEIEGPYQPHTAYKTLGGAGEKSTVAINPVGSTESGPSSLKGTTVISLLTLLIQKARELVPVSFEIPHSISWQRSQSLPVVPNLGELRRHGKILPALIGLNLQHWLKAIERTLMSHVIF